MEDETYKTGCGRNLFIRLLLFSPRSFLLNFLFWRLLLPVSVGREFLTKTSAFRLWIIAAGVSVGLRASLGLAAAAGGQAGEAVFRSLAARKLSHPVIRAL